MTVRIVHKNSVAEDKRPTAGQLANGEIAVNLHEASAFLSIKDTAGNVQQVGGVKVSNNSPANPVKGTFWLDSDNNTLFIYDGTQWRGVTGGGGGGGGSINLAEGDAINITQAGSTYTINVVAGAGITLAGDNVAVELDTDATTVGLKMVGAGDAGKLSAKVATASTLGAVKVDDTTIKVDSAGEIRAVIPDPLVYKGNLNPTTEDSGPDSISSFTGSPGDAYTCSWGGTKVEGTLGTTPADKNWAGAIKGSDTTATLGDLLIINSGDGSGADEWTLVKTGTVDSGASIDVGDGTTAAFPPASPQQGDVWYNLDDGRTYVYITDSSGDTVWVDISPQGNQTLWKKDSGNDIEPQTNTDDLKIPNLAGGTATTGTTVVMADTNGVLVSNAVGDGLEISSGQLQVRQDSTSSGVNLQTVTDAGNTTDNAMTCGGTPNTGAVGATIDPNGFVAATVATGGKVFVGRKSGATTETTQIFDDGGVILDGPGAGDSVDLRRGSLWAWQGIQGGVRTSGIKWNGGVDFKNDSQFTGSRAFSDGATTLAESYSKAAFRITPSNNSSNCINIGPEGTGSNMYIQGSNNPGNATRDFYLQRFGGNVILGRFDSTTDGVNGCEIRSDGLIRAQRASNKGTSAVFQGWIGVASPDSAKATSTIKANGSAEFAGNIQTGTWNGSTGLGTTVGASGTVAIRPATTGASNVLSVIPTDTGILNLALRADGTADFRHDDNTVYNSTTSILDSTLKLSNYSTTTNSFVGIKFLSGSASTGLAGINAVRTGGQQTALSFSTSRPADSGGREVVRIDHNGKVILTGSAPAGIQFGSTNASGNITSQTLDDYEEGTWTPTLTGFTNWTVQTATYTKVGRVVNIFLRLISAGSNGEVATNYEITGAPFGNNCSGTFFCDLTRGTSLGDGICRVATSGAMNGGLGSAVSNANGATWSYTCQIT